MPVALVRPKRAFSLPCGGNRYACSSGGGLLRGMGGGAGACLSRMVCWLLTICLCLALLAALSVGLLAAYRWLTNYEFFTLKTIEVVGNQRLSYGEVVDAAAVSVGDNALGVPMHEIENRLVSNPWIKGVRVKRMLPGALRISVTERVPCFWVNRDGRMQYADEYGRIIAPVEPGKFSSLPVLKVTGMTQDELALLPEIVQGIDALRPPFALADAVWVGLSPGKGLELYLDGQDRLLSVGLADWKANLARLGAVWKDLEQRGELGAVRAIRAHGENVWVRRDGGPMDDGR
ncbi:MAG: cell division protein FtsQ/DivIB [Desulfovibrionaceae bacterium]